MKATKLTKENSMHTLTPKIVESKFEKVFLSMNTKTRGPKGKLTVAQLATLCWMKAEYRIACWKDFFENDVIRKGVESLTGWTFCSYGRFMLRIPFVLALLKKALTLGFSRWNGFGAIDSTMISLGAFYNAENKLCYKKIRKEGAKLGHGSLGKCFGVKLTSVINSEGKICNIQLNSASSHDLTPVKNGILNSCVGVVLADRGYVSREEKEKLNSLGVALWARPRENQDEQFNSVQKKIYKCRETVESVFSKLKKRFLMVPSFPPRRMSTARAQICGAILAYMWNENTPKMNYSFGNGVKSS